MKIHAIRLHPGEDLKLRLLELARQDNISAAAVITCVGSLRCAALRFAGRKDTTHVEKKLEIVSLVGTFSISGAHFHISLSDDKGVLIGGHLQEGCLINTTAEIVAGEFENLVFERSPDPATGYKELLIRKR